MGRHRLILHWSEEQDALLRGLRDKGQRWVEIAKQLGRSAIACRTRYITLLDNTPAAPLRPPKPPPQRLCLKCHKTKVLGWSFCERCRERLHDLDTPYAE